MEKRVLTLELVVEQNTKMVERLDRSMAQLTQAMADLRVEMGKGFSDLRQGARVFSPPLIDVDSLLGLFKNWIKYEIPD